MGLMCIKQLAKLAMLMLLPLLLLCFGVANVYCSTVHENGVDLHSLLDFKEGITSDPKGVLSTWNTNTHFCRWNGVNCNSTRPWRVTTLNLTGQSLSGQISSSLGNLTFLNKLDLSKNNFIGPLPLLSNLQHLEIVFLQVNFLHGIIPDTLTNCSNLKRLELSKNLLTGVIPPSIGNLSKLVFLGLYQNNLTGIIPPALGNITTLEQITLAENQLNGRILDELWHMPNIVKLYLNENNLSGGIPQTLSNLSSLQILSLSSNMLGNALPSNIGDALPNLQTLQLGKNMFEGQIPASLGNASGLELIDLPLNYFTGQIPSSFGKLANLTILNLDGNKLEARDSDGWAFFHALANCSLLEVVSLANNQLHGVVPNSIGNLSTNLQFLVMGENNLSGIVPPSIGRFHGLIQLSLEENNLIGTTEEWIGKLIKLQSLNLEANNFIGTIPHSIGNLTQLTWFSLAKNELAGFIPPSLGNLTQLTKLLLAKNKFDGLIPSGLGSLSLVELDLSYNNLHGSIPVEFGNLKQLTTLNLSSNKFSGEIPEALSQCQMLLNIQMDQNVLTGNIPTTFSNLKSLTLLNLSHNNLSGTLPACLNDLKLLTKLDLSYNNFQGEIPRSGVLDNATVVSLDGNSGLCGGTIDLHMPSCHAVSRRVGRVNYLVKILIPIFGFMSLIMLIYNINLGKKTSITTYLSLLSFGKKFPRVSYMDLARATGNFSESNLIGRGSYGSVYRGKITQAKIQVAIKVFDLEMRSADKSFVSECEVLRGIRHRNLLPILTACSTIDTSGNSLKALIYELMPNGNLDTWLHKIFAGFPSKWLSLAQRISIAVDIADVLAYLHHDCERPIVHCDLKPTNILLDDDMNAYLGDFGIASLVVDSRFASVGHSSSTNSIGLKGTIGYIAPEYAQCGHASTCGDVYSFGTVLLELLIGKRPTHSMFENELNIVNFVERNFPDQILHIIDTHLHEEWKDFNQATEETENEFYRCLLSVVQVALSCTRQIPRERMNMREVATKLHAIRTSYVGAKKREQIRLRSVNFVMEPV